MESNIPLGYLLNRTLRIFRNQITSQFRMLDYELTFEQFVMLRMLNANCDMIQQDFANELQKDKSIIVRQINGLLNDQYITRETNIVDKRKKNLILTPKGLEIMNQLQEISSDLSEKLLAGVTESEYETFKKVILKIQENGGSES